jgi:hypothetical protein
MSLSVVMMKSENAAWFVMTLLLLLSVLMIFHLIVLWVGVAICRDYAEAVIDPAVTVTGADTVASYCAIRESSLAEAVDKYLSVILSLIGGAAVSGGVAASARKDDEP